MIDEMIEVIGKKIILWDIIKKKKQSGYRVSADEATSSNDKMLITRFCLFRFNDKKLEIQENFAIFLNLEQVTGEHNAWKIIDFHSNQG